MEHDDILNDDVPDALANLPRTTPVTPGELEQLAEQLRREGFFRRPRVVRWAAGAAAALAIFTLGAIAGDRHARASSLEQMLVRTDLTMPQRILLLQRAGSAYVRAAQAYADATAHVDSAAVEVATQVLIGAAHAVARSGLDAGLSQDLSSVLTSAVAPIVNRKPVIWF